MKLGLCMLALALAPVVSCGAAVQGPRPSPPPRTCLVLSVGSFSALAELGAIQAVRESGIHVDCVVGTSMGSLVGALYASSPSQDTTARARQFSLNYQNASRRDGIGTGVAIAGLAALAVFTLGASLVGSAIVGGVAGYGAGHAEAHPPNRDRVVAVIADMTHNVRIESLPVPYLTLHQTRAGNSLVVVDDDYGNLATAVGNSIANPYIFGGNPVQMTALDPGADQVSAVPVDAACRHFPRARLIIVNVTAIEPFVRIGTRCPILEIRIATGAVNEAQALTLGPEFERLVRLGYVAARPRLVAWRPSDQ